MPRPRTYVRLSLLELGMKKIVEFS